MNLFIDGLSSSDDVTESIAIEASVTYIESMGHDLAWYSSAGMVDFGTYLLTAPPGSPNCYLNSLIFKFMHKTKFLKLHSEPTIYFYRILLDTHFSSYQNEVQVACCWINHQLISSNYHLPIQLPQMAILQFPIFTRVSEWQTKTFSATFPIKTFSLSPFDRLPHAFYYRP